MRARIGDVETKHPADSDVWLGAFLAVVDSALLPAHAAEKADEAVKLYRERFPLPTPEEVRT